MALINVSNLTFSYEGSYDNIFENASFQIDTNWKLGFIGRNGRGKTTFLKLLMGEHEYSGTISTNTNFDYFPIEVKDLTALTINVLESIAPDVQLWQLQKEISKLDVADDVLHRPFNTLSNGEQTKVLLAGLFLRKNSFLLIDEPTSHLDAAARQTVAEYLKSKTGFILVSHDRFFIDECVDHILSINKNDIEVLSGNYTTWAEQKERQDAFEIAQNKRLKLEIDRLKKAARQSAAWSNKAEKGKYGIQSSGLKADRGYVGHKAAKMMKRSKVIENRQNAFIEEKSALLKNIEIAEGLKMQPLKFYSDQLLALNDISVSYGDKEILSGFNLEVTQGERVALLGKNGSGKSTILKLLLGKNIPHTGTVKIGSRLIISYVPQDICFLNGTVREYAKKRGIDQTLFMSILHKLDFSRMQFEKDISDFSSGQKKKILIAGSLCERAHIYIWDEPLNYIDILSRVQIENLILEYDLTMVFVEHDIAFCDNIATKTIQM